MSNRTIALFCDVSNLYYCVNRKYNGKKLNFEKLYQEVSKMGSVYRAFAYGSQMNTEAIGFITALKAIGYDTKYKLAKQVKREGKEEIWKINWNVGITVDVFRVLERVDTVVISSADPELVPLVQFVKDRGVRCIVMACGISRELKEVADQYTEIASDLVEEEPVTSKKE